MLLREEYSKSDVWLLVSSYLVSVSLWVFDSIFSPFCILK